MVYVYESVNLILTFNVLLVNGFHMAIVTHSYARSEKMSESQELFDYFSELVQLLANVWSKCFKNERKKQSQSLKKYL